MKLRYSAKRTKRQCRPSNAHFVRNVGAEQRVRVDRQSDQRPPVLFRTRGSAIRRKSSTLLILHANQIEWFAEVSQARRPALQEIGSGQ